jgi:hypothetical protein
MRVMKVLSLPTRLPSNNGRPCKIVGVCLVAGLAACADALLLREAAAAEPQPIVVRGRRLPVLPGRAARMAARGEIFAIVPPPAQPPIVIREQAPPVIIREQAATGGIREQFREQVRGGVGRDLPARMSEMARVAAEVAQALQAPGVAAAGTPGAAAPAAQAAAKAPAAVNPPAAATAVNPRATNPFDKQGVEPASVLVPQPPQPQPPQPQPAENLPPIELLPTP